MMPPASLDRRIHKNTAIRYPFELLPSLKSGKLLIIFVPKIAADIIHAASDSPVTLGAV